MEQTATAVVARPALMPDDPGAHLRHTVFLVVWLAIVAVGLGRGFDYYLTPFGQRPQSEQYSQFRPAGTDGLKYGIIGTGAIALGVIAYSLRKRARVLARGGKLKYWLEVHIFLCSIGPALIVLHTSFRVGGLVGIAFWSMVIVTLSGVFGRYVYVRIPRTVQGQFAGLEAVERERAALLEGLQTELGPRADEIARVLATPSRRPVRGLVSALAAAVAHDLRRRKNIRRLTALLARYRLPTARRRRVVDLFDRGARLEQQIALLVPFQRLFHYWHVLHLPLALTMLVVVAIHVTVAALFGYGWAF
jgi:hypothetical protein